MKIKKIYIHIFKKQSVVETKGSNNEWSGSHYTKLI